MSSQATASPADVRLGLSGQIAQLKADVHGVLATLIQEVEAKAGVRLEQTRTTFETVAGNLLAKLEQSDSRVAPESAQIGSRSATPGVGGSSADPNPSSDQHTT